MAASLLKHRLYISKFRLEQIEVLRVLLIQSTSPVTLAGVQAVRYANMKTADIKWRAHRRRKVLKVQLPDYEEERRHKKLTPDEIRSEMKARGIVPPTKWSEKPMFFSSTSEAFDPYVPPEGDGKKSFVSLEGAKQLGSHAEKRTKSFLAIRKIRKFDEAFDVHDFAEAAQDIYVEVNEKLMNIKENEDRLHDLVTEYCYPVMIDNLKYRTIRWNFIKSLEPARVVHVRSPSTSSDEDVFSQITVRFHSQQTLAVYDRFGRLMHGSEIVAKDVLEYVVFEKKLSNDHGAWRIHAKIIPDWMPAKEPVKITYVKPQPPPELQEEKEKSSKTKAEETM